MMAHAMGTSHNIWDRQVPALVDRYRLLRYDWRGHGDTDAPPAGSMEEEMAASEESAPSV